MAIGLQVACKSREKRGAKASNKFQKISNFQKLGKINNNKYIITSCIQ